MQDNFCTMTHFLQELKADLKQSDAVTKGLRGELKEKDNEIKVCVCSKIPLLLLTSATHDSFSIGAQESIGSVVIGA